MLISAGMYFFNNGVVAEIFTQLGYLTYIIYPLAIAKILGLVAIWTKKSNTLKEWAYAGFFFDFILALSAHLYVKDGKFAPHLLQLSFWCFPIYLKEKLGKEIDKQKIIKIETKKRYKRGGDLIGVYS